MRRHRGNAILAPWTVGDGAIDPDRLAVVRVEPVLWKRSPALVLDLVFGADAGHAVVPTVIVTPAEILGRERDPLVFPEGVPDDDALAAELVARVVPHLEALVLGGEPIGEHVVALRPFPAFDAARTAGLVGAAPLSDALRLLAPYRFARRFARGRVVRLAAPGAVGGWAALRDVADPRVAPADAEPAAVAWYGAPRPLDATHAAVAVVAAGAPAPEGLVVRVGVPGIALTAAAPLDIVFSEDPREGPAAITVAVERIGARRLPAAADLGYRPAGGSAGRIAIVAGRGDAATVPGADLDEATALAAALRAEGFDAALGTAESISAGTALVHLVGVRDGRRARAAAERARTLRVPLVVTAHDDDAAAGGWWGAVVTRFCFEYGDEERDVARYLTLLAKRAVTLGDVRPDAPYTPDPAAAAEADAVLRDADLVLAASDEEASAIRRRTRRRGPIAIVPPLAPSAVPDPDAAGPVPEDPFLLVHAPIGPAGNQLLVARAARDARLPLVVAGPVADASYLERVREVGGLDLVVRPEPDPGGAAALRALAGVVVDAAWVGEGGARLAASALAGTRLAVASRRASVSAGTAARRFDPADVEDLTRAIVEAWDDAVGAPRRVAPELLEELLPTRVVRRVVAAYASIDG